MPPEIGTSTQADGHQQGEQLLYFQYSCFLPYIFIYISGMRKKKITFLPRSYLTSPILFPPSFGCGGVYMFFFVPR